MKSYPSFFIKFFGNLHNSLPLQEIVSIVPTPSLGSNEIKYLIPFDFSVLFLVGTYTLGISCFLLISSFDFSLSGVTSISGGVIGLMSEVIFLLYQTTKIINKRKNKKRKKKGICFFKVIYLLSPTQTYPLLKANILSFTS